jgi:cell division protein FtsL
LLVTKKKVQSGYFPAQQLPDRERNRSQGKVPAGETASWNSLAFCVLLFFILLTSVGLISQYSRVIAVKYQIHQVQQEIEALQNEIEHLQIEVKSLSSLERIETIAKNDLGLQYPEKRQWIRIARSE